DHFARRLGRAHPLGRARLWRPRIRPLAGRGSDVGTLSFETDLRLSPPSLPGSSRQSILPLALNPLTTGINPVVTGEYAGLARAIGHARGLFQPIHPRLAGAAGAHIADRIAGDGLQRVERQVAPLRIAHQHRDPRPGAGL